MAPTETEVHIYSVPRKDGLTREFQVNSWGEREGKTTYWKIKMLGTPWHKGLQCYLNHLKNLATIANQKKKDFYNRGSINRHQLWLKLSLCLCIFSKTLSCPLLESKQIKEFYFTSCWQLLCLEWQEPGSIMVQSRSKKSRGIPVCFWITFSINNYAGICCQKLEIKNICRPHVIHL